MNIICPDTSVTTVINFDYTWIYTDQFSDHSLIRNKGAGSGCYIGYNSIDDYWKDLMEGCIKESSPDVDNHAVWIFNTSNIKCRVLSPDEILCTTDDDCGYTISAVNSSAPGETFYPNISYLEGDLMYIVHPRT